MDKLNKKQGFSMSEFIIELNKKEGYDTPFLDDPVMCIYCNQLRPSYSEYLEHKKMCIFTIKFKINK